MDWGIIITAVAMGVMLVLALVVTRGHEKCSSSTDGITLSFLGREKPWMRKIVYVSRLPASFTDERLSELFVSHGTVEVTWVVRSRITGHSEGYGFVMMGTEEEARGAVAALSGTRAEGTLLVFRSISRNLSLAQDGFLASERIC